MSSSVKLSGSFISDLKSQINIFFPVSSEESSNNECHYFMNYTECILIKKKKVLFASSALNAHSFSQAAVYQQQLQNRRRVVNFRWQMRWRQQQAKSDEFKRCFNFAVMDHACRRAAPLSFLHRHTVLTAWNTVSATSGRGRRLQTGKQTGKQTGWMAFGDSHRNEAREPETTQAARRKEQVFIA